MDDDLDDYMFYLSWLIELLAAGYYWGLCWVWLFLVEMFSLSWDNFDVTVGYEICY